MKYMLMMNVPGKAPYPISTWPRKDAEDSEPASQRSRT